MNPAPATKDLLRARARLLLASLPDAAGRSRELCARLVASDLFTAAGVVLVYLHIPGEPDCTPILDAALAAGKTLCAPEVSWETGTLTPVRLRHGAGGWRLTPPARHGVRGPQRDRAGGDEIDPGAIDLALVPGLAFDLRGGRLGRGGGFYDRLLPRLSPRASACGVCFDAQIIEAVPMNESDAAVDALATDRRLLRVEPDAHLARRRTRHA